MALPEMPEPLETRRQFTRSALQSLTALALLEGLHARQLFGKDVKPIVDSWIRELQSLSQDVHDNRIKDIEFQKLLEALYARADLPALLKTLDFEKISREVNYPAVGARSLAVDLSKVTGLPAKLVFGRQIFAMAKGRSVIPHGHDNMATGFLVLNGTLRGRHWDRVEDNKDHYLIRPTIDRSFNPGEFSTISDHKDNVHWFTAESDHAFLFNIHVDGYNSENPKRASRVYVDPLGEKVAGGLIRAPKITYGQANKLYG